MSQDYAAIIVGLNGAVLLVATIQYGALSRKALQASAARDAAHEARWEHLLETRRGGADPSVDELLGLYRYRPGRSIVYGLASFVYMSVCLFIMLSTKSVLQWSGSAKPEPNPELAKRAFIVAVAAVGLLILEALATTVVSFFSQAFAHRMSYAMSGTDQELRELHALIAGARRPQSTPPPDPGPDPDPAP
ncbi:hypothetical protein [Streptomyces sp. PA03-2a]|uniref:hypothetical protein n=1 Tax=Streptomyces sp. PA03-2a TaxID=3028701 RepID=UPI0029B07787|nr:hypothetical protein [Streptomyces sp. PA03-2a]MDX2730998.1 hypothetical protein [Streptomyces sp. PA03-2a]